MSDTPHGLESTLPTAASPALGRIGDYHLLQLVGTGGMGEVYEAEQERPVRRRVAIKLIKLGMDTREVVARFESERQALALLNHPLIAQVYDAGTAPDGRPYFVMEYVPGIRITTYCDRNQLPLSQRLRLFQQVCEAIQHAHQKGIIHRDLKSSNILVAARDGEPRPKVIDFGVAKATGARLTDQTIHTELGRMIGTLEYMSPEQAGITPLDVDTRSDIYSLGVLLHELLVGVRPFERRDTETADSLALIERIRREEPVRPSARVAPMGDAAAPIAKARGSDPPSLRRQLEGDLDWIVLKAIEKDRTRRYGSASELGADIARHLGHEPVSASPPSSLYRLRKFTRRHRVAVAAGFAIAMTLMAGVIGTTLMLIRAVRAERLARQEAETAKRTTDFLVELFQVADPGEARGTTITAREILDKGAERIRRELKGEPLVQARLINTMGNVYRGLGLYPRSKELLNEALALRTRTLGPDHPDVAATLNDLSFAHYLAGELPRAAECSKRALAINEASLGPDHLQTAWSRYYFGMNQTYMGNTREGEPLIRSALLVFRRDLGADVIPAAWCLNDLAAGYLMREEFSRALPLLQEATSIKEKQLGPNHPDMVVAHNNLAYAHLGLRNFKEAEKHVDVAVVTCRRVLGARHPSLAAALHTKADVLRAQGKVAEVEPVLLEVIAIHDAGEKHHVDLPHSLWTLAVIRSTLGRHAEAEENFRRSIRLYSTIRPSDPNLISCLEDYARMLDGLRRSGEAADLRSRADQIRGRG